MQTTIKYTPIEDVRVHRNSLDSPTYSVSCNCKDGRYHVWVNAQTKKMQAGDNKLYKNPLPGVHFDTRYLKADLAKNAAMIEHMLLIAETNHLLDECDAKLREKQEIEDRKAEAEYREELKKQAGPKLYDALKQMLKLVNDLMPGVKDIALPDYALLNDAPLQAQAAIAEAEGKPVATESVTP
jgi:hypothetical protein